MVVYCICFQEKAIEMYGTYKIAKIPNSVLATGIPILALVIGTLTFSIYRSLIYGLIILRVIDAIDRDNVRDFLMKKYEILKRTKADALWKTIREKRLREESEHIDLGSASIHLLYMSALVVLALLVFLLIDNCMVLKSLLVLVPFSFFAISAAAVLSDRHMQTVEYLLLKSIKSEELDDLVATIGFNKKIIKPPASP